MNLDEYITKRIDQVPPEVAKAMAEMNFTKEELAVYMQLKMAMDVAADISDDDNVLVRMAMPENSLRLFSAYLTDAIMKHLEDDPENAAANVVLGVMIGVQFERSRNADLAEVPEGQD